MSASLPLASRTSLGRATSLDAGPHAARARVLFAEHERHVAERTDRFFGGLLLIEYVAGIVVALGLSPRTWVGPAWTHPHVPAAVLGGAAVVLWPAWLALFRPGRQANRYVLAVAQMLFGSLLIHLTGGDLETHFHVFGSLAFLAAYRDWRVVATGTAVVVLDHAVRGLWWPMSLYGVAAASPFRFVEHAFWALFEDAFLIPACIEWRREMRDIARRQAATERQGALERSVEAERAANDAKSEFLANMSHEIRTPMTAIIGYADLLLEPEIEAKDHLEYVQTIRRNGDHLLRVINDILDLSKIEAGKLEVETLPSSPAQLVVDVASLMRVRAIEKGLRFAVEFATPIPVTIATDPTRVRQVLMNLVGNAIKFTEAGSVRVVVRCHDADGPSPSLTFEVADTGIGLSREAIARLFQAFSQADGSTTRRFGGSGLGLVISRRLARMLGGDIAVESLVGRGSSFTLTLPTGSLEGVAFVDELEEAGTPAAMMPLGARTAAARVEARVLLAEDGIDNQVLITTHLRKAGATVVTAENGRVAVDAALEAAASGTPFDVILMDMQMPELDGYGATAKLRAKGYRLPIVALTAHAMAGDRDKCIAAGCDDYMTKPVDRDALIAMVARHARMKATVAAPEAAADAAAPSAQPSPAEAPASQRGIASAYADDPDMTELVDAFVAGMPQRAQALRKADEAGDLSTVATLAHQLKGASGGYGFPALGDAARAVEAAAKRGDRAALAVALGVTLASMARLLPATGSPTP